jgi:hypothetical protein
MVDSSGSTYCCEVVKRLDLARFLQYHATTKILFDEMMVKKKSKNPDIPILILKTMQSETHIFFVGLTDG